jgi:hypothetical protein
VFFARFFHQIARTAKTAKVLPIKRQRALVATAEAGGRPCGGNRSSYARCCRSSKLCGLWGLCGSLSALQFLPSGFGCGCQAAPWNPWRFAYSHWEPMHFTRACCRFSSSDMPRSVGRTTLVGRCRFPGSDRSKPQLASTALTRLTAALNCFGHGQIAFRSGTYLPET